MGDHHAKARAAVNTFYRENGELGTTVLEAFSSVDPLNCFRGWEINCDEYLGYAKRLVAALRERAGYEQYDPLRWEVLVEIVRRSFSADQVVRHPRVGWWVKPEDIEAIARIVARHRTEGYTVTSDWAFFHPEDAEALM